MQRTFRGVFDEVKSISQSISLSPPSLIFFWSTTVFYFRVIHRIHREREGECGTMVFIMHVEEQTRRTIWRVIVIDAVVIVLLIAAYLFIPSKKNAAPPTEDTNTTSTY